MTHNKRETTLLGWFSFGAGYGNRFAFSSHWEENCCVVSVQPGASRCPPNICICSVRLPLLHFKRKTTLLGWFSFGAGYGSRFAFSSHWEENCCVAPVQPGASRCPPDICICSVRLPLLHFKRKTTLLGWFSFGAGYGSRTRLHGLGSRCITDIRILRCVKEL